MEKHDAIRTGKTARTQGRRKGPVALAAIALSILAVGFNGLSLLGVPYWLQPIFNGVVLIIAVITAAAEGKQILK